MKCLLGGQLWIATTCFFFSNTTAKAFTKKKKKSLSSAYGHFNFSSDESE